MKKRVEKKSEEYKDFKIKLLVVFGILLGAGLIIAYPILDSGISDSLLEDTFPAYTYNFTQNISDSGGGIEGNLIFSIEAINSSSHNFTEVEDYTWIFIDSETGVMTLNATQDNETGNFTISIHVIDSSTEGTTIATVFNVTPVNDAPSFVGLSNQSFNMSELFEYIVNVSDEENNIPYFLNITFISCDVAEWSSRNCSNSSGRKLFNSSDYNFNSTRGVLNISFIPSRNDVGSYIINFSVMDNSSLGNKTTSQLVNFSVLNRNSAPFFRYVCDNERNTTENSEFTCWINISDIDETYNLTIRTNYSWFIFNKTQNNSITKNVSILTDYNASAMINFTANDLMVGNWTINISVSDTGELFDVQKVNSTLIWFFINNSEDTVSLDSVGNYTIYEDKIIYVNAYDDDLLIPDKSVKNEVLTFASNTSWVNISSYSSEDNHTTAKIEIDYDAGFAEGTGNYTININVTDSAGNFAEKEFIIEILADSPVAWDSLMQEVFVIYEGNETYLNFTQNTTDPEGDSIMFSFVNDSAFPSFNIDSNTGVINFTALDVDVGYHNVIINASDGKLDSLKSFNFTIYNVNDVPVIKTPLETTNASIDANLNINSSEDNYTIITLWVEDDDFKILSNQKSFYNESLNINLNISGPNINLFSFVRDDSFPIPSYPNKTKYLAIFTPNKTDVGNYNITINVSDLGNLSDVLSFNLTVFEKLHNPVLEEVENQTIKINQNFNYDLNATDSEDGSDAEGNLVFNYDFLFGADFINNNQTIFNTTSGIFNFTFNSSQGGRYHLNISVNDTDGDIDFIDFWIYVYDFPNINFPLEGHSFNLTENSTANLTFQVNHSVGTNLTYLFYTDSIVYVLNTSGNNTYWNFSYSNLSLIKNQTFYGNNTNFTWEFTPNFTDETYGLNKNMTLMVFSSLYPELNASQTWNLNISHANAPVTFETNIGKQSRDYNTAITINLTNYFHDYDFLDNYYNQSFNFSIFSDTSPSYLAPYATVSSDWILTIPAPLKNVVEFLTINATDLDDNNLSLTSALSNAFEVEFTTPAYTPTPSGGGSVPRPYAFKIIAPGKISAYTNDRIKIPLTLVNKGVKAFKEISLTSEAFKEGIVSNKVLTFFDRNKIDLLKRDEIENLTLTVFLNTNKTGDYEILINATSKSPKYTDWTKIYINLQRLNESEVERYLLFTEEYIVQNPECLELKELVDEAKALFEKGEYSNARLKSEQIVSACEESISQVSLPKVRPLEEIEFRDYLALTSLGSFLLGISYYLIKRRRFKKSMQLPD